MRSSVDQDRGAAADAWCPKSLRCRLLGTLAPTNEACDLGDQVAFPHSTAVVIQEILDRPG